MKTEVIILRGVSGSGKSTFAKQYIEALHKRTPVSGGQIFSSDDYWTLDGGDYTKNFDITKLGQAHAWNLRRFITYLDVLEIASGHSCSTLIIDNTNTTVAEIAPYYAVAEAYGREARIITIDTNPSVAFDRNTHGVPKTAHDAQVERFYAAMETFPKHWRHLVMKGTL